MTFSKASRHLPGDRDLNVVAGNAEGAVAEIDAGEPSPGGELGRRHHVLFAVVDPKQPPALDRIDADPVGFLRGHRVQYPHRTRGLDERLGAAGIIGGGVTGKRIRLAQVMQQADSTGAVVSDLLEDLSDRVDADVRILVDEVRGDEGVEHGDVYALAPDRLDHGVTQSGVDGHTFRPLDRKPERAVMS